MKTLLQLEWMKARKYRTFWIFIILFLVTLAGVNGVLYSIQVKFGTLSGGQADLHLFDSQWIWSSTAWASGFSILVLGLLLIVMITNEFTFRTHRQQIMEGISRTGFLTGKWLMALVFTLFAWILYLAVTLILGTMSHTGGGTLATGFRFALYFLLKVSLSMSVAAMFGLWLKRPGVAIVLYLVYALLLEGILGFILNRILPGLGHFLPLQVGGTLVSNPAVHLMPGLGGGSVPVTGLVAAGVAYLAVFVSVSLYYFRRANL